MGRTARAKTRFGAQIRNYMAIAGLSSSTEAKTRLVLEPKKPAPDAKPRNPAAHPWRYTGQAKGRIFKDIDLIPFDHKKDVPYGVCFNCWAYDHQQGNCKKPTLEDHCQNCGRIGVKVSNCPRCRRAYQVYRKKNTVKPTNDDESSLAKDKTKMQKDEGEKDCDKSLERELSSAPTTEDDYLSYDEHISFEEEYDYEEAEDFTKIIVDESIYSAIITAEFLDNFLNLVNAMKYLPAKRRAEVAQNYLFEHRRQLRQQSFEG